MSLLVVSSSVIATAAAAAPREIVVAPEGGTAFSTLSGAVAAASPGTIIRLRPGVYAETVVVDKDLVIVGISPDDPAVLDGEGRRPLLRIESAVTCRFENLTLRDGFDHDGAGVLVRGGAVADFLNCSFHDNLARHEGGAVMVRGRTSWAEFIGCHFQRNRALQNAGAVSVRDGAEVTLRACTFYGNTTDGLCGGVASLDAAPLAVEDCLFIQNQGFECGAIRVADAPASIVGNTFFQNASLDGASVYLHDEEGTFALDVTNNIFAGDLEGAGLCVPATAQRGCNLFSDNLAGSVLDGTPTGDELVADPCFCDFRALDLTLRRSSPAADRTSDCGRIGALDVGCLEGLEAAVSPFSPRRRVR
jgi:hypothetical protein